MFHLCVALRAGSDLQLAASQAAAAALRRHRAQGGRPRSRCHHLSDTDYDNHPLLMRIHMNLQPSPGALRFVLAYGHI